VRAQCRLADEFDAAQERGEVAKQGKPKSKKPSQKEGLATIKDIGLTWKQVHEARQIRNAEQKNPGAIDAQIDLLALKLYGPNARLRAESDRANARISLLREQAVLEKGSWTERAAADAQKARNARLRAESDQHSVKSSGFPEAARNEKGRWYDRAAAEAQKAGLPTTRNRIFEKFKTRSNKRALLRSVVAARSAAF
jgi:hypothetical protein